MKEKQKQVRHTTQSPSQSKLRPKVYFGRTTIPTTASIHLQLNANTNGMLRTKPMNSPEEDPSNKMT
eukprot:c5605_g1_i1 orf=67-267(+)